jgi:hypothetical protein
VPEASATRFRPKVVVRLDGAGANDEDDKAVALVIGLMTRAGNWWDGLRIVRRAKPYRWTMQPDHL